MDKKSLAIFTACFVLLLAWGPFVNNVLYPVDERAELTNTNAVEQVEGAAVPIETVGASPDTGSGRETPAPTNPVSAPPAVAVVSEASQTPAEIVTLESELATYHITDAGGGIQFVDLKNYPNDTGCKTTQPWEGQSTYAQLNPWADQPILGLRLGSELIQGFELEESNGVVTLTRDLASGLRIEKTLEPGTNYLVRAKTRIVNTGTEALSVPDQHWNIGTSTPLAPEDNGILMGLMYFTEGDTDRIKESWFANRTLGCFPGRPRSLFVHNSSPVDWGSVDNQFFTVAMIPSKPADQLSGTQEPLKFDDGTSSQFTTQKGYRGELMFKGQVLQPNEAIECDFDVFAGPKEYYTLSKLSSSFGNELDAIMNFGGFFGFFAKALLLSMNSLHGLGLSYGFAIVAITFIIKLLFWPLTQASTRSMKRMAALQPQMKEIQEKYKEDPQKMNRKLMEFMRENRVSPLGGCLPILLQLPVFFGFYTMLQSAIELRGASFLWTCDLSKPDTLFFIPGLDIPFNLWPLLMGAAQLWQTSMTPPSPGMDPAQQKMMKYMPLMFVFILYNFSAGLALYWTVQNLLSIVQMKLTKNEPVEVVPANRSLQGMKKAKRAKGKPGI